MSLRSICSTVRSHIGFPQFRNQFFLYLLKCFPVTDHFSTINKRNFFAINQPQNINKKYLPSPFEDKQCHR